ncbi:HEAT repeat domain-containing protein [Prolixibacteraceae bacterium Z1-6]|uniref:HEAT repeat domain-containing protein n=1 Tax=Draconibacterium aestuarii TaxID=2998507 RepID=A0A9X3J7V9_9BACT|nr:HEAT repeat domain-containing protein [Prolixibacteraceae bacterium Z1-6]
MKRLWIIVILTFGLLVPARVLAQDRQTEIDSLITLMRTAGREWNNYAGPLIKIGEPAVPALIKNVQDKNLKQWNRRIAMMTLNQIHSPQWMAPARAILFDENEDPVLRNHATAALRGENLSDVKTELWRLFTDADNQFHKSNLAHLLVGADTALAYRAFYELYTTQDGHIQRSALLNLARLRPEESTSWFLKALQGNDWMTANLAMDSLIGSSFFDAEVLLSVYKKPNVNETVQWRIIYVLGHRQDAAIVPVLVEALQNKYWLVHTEATVGLCRFEPEVVLNELKNLGNDSRPFVQKNSKWITQQLKRE